MPSAKGRRESRVDRKSPKAVLKRIRPQQSVSFDDSRSERSPRSKDSTDTDDSSSSEYEIVELYNNDSGGYDDFVDEVGEEKTATGTEYPPSQAYMIIAAVMVASAFLGVLMKFAFTPGHAGHSHGLRKPPPAPAPRRPAFTYECRTDACLWQSRLVYDKINQSLGPCEDFYGYVCSNRWYNPELEVQNRPYVVSGPGLLILDIAKFLIQYRPKDEPKVNFITHASSMLKNCIQVRTGNASDADWKDLKKLFDMYSLTNWPFMTDPPSTKFQDVLKVVDKTLRLLPVVHVTLRKRFENEGYMMHLEEPRLTMVRHQITFLEEGFQEYKNCIKRAFALLGSKADTDHIAEDVLELERKLDEASTPGKRFVSVLNSTVSIVNLKRAGKLEWDAYLTYLQPGSDKVIVLNMAYINKLSAILTSTALSTLLNYVGFRIVACIHLVERLYPYGIRKIARAAMGKTAMEQVAYDHNLDKLVGSVKGVMSQAVARAPWLTQAEADVATQKIESLEVDFIGAKEHMDAIARYYDSNLKVQFTIESAMRDYTTLVNETASRYWRSKDNADYDARYHVTSLRPGFEYNAGKNVLHIPFGVVAVQNRVAQSSVPAILVPYIVPYLVQGMYEAIDVRGATINVRGMPETWWSSESLVRYRQQQKCFTQDYIENIQRFGTFQESPMAPFLRSSMAEIASVQPTFEAYVRALVAPHSMQRNFRIPGLPDLTPEMLFFVNFAVSHCDPIATRGLSILDRRQIKYRIALPSSLRVNIPLRHLDTFAETFSCAKGTHMNPGYKCRLW
ncbi:hypothetical protein HPB48_006031 [Haemaphysalis longicornis]|uniref:Uncharacterized protein n=1 Tax=Haemaphysalis longicornis TaxID=44386 RepID=A0A9J6FMA9_HAELO|nr:hypothetical protein HPB48_006031 [Haemaphysalis longicornis]